MANCPNINLDSWKDLVAARGEDVAYYLWDKYDGNIPESESKSEIVKSGLKATNLLQSPKADQFFASVAKNKISGDFFWKKMQADLGIPKEQIELLKSFNTTDRNELIANMLANYSYTVEINVAKETTFKQKPSGFREESEDKVQAYTDSEGNTKWQVINTEIGVIEDNFSSKEDALAFIGADVTGSKPTSYYSNLTVPGGTNYIENEIATPAITPSIKGHAQFATDKGIGWFRSDEQRSDKLSEQDYQESLDYIKEELDSGRDDIDTYNEKLARINAGETEEAVGSKTRRILEVQSDLFQKGRDEKKALAWNRYLLDNKGNVIGENPNFQSEQNFLNLLRKDNNWVTFFVKSIIQDSAKKGYEKVLFPSGNTASKVEGHTTLEEFKREKENRIKQLENKKYEAFQLKNGKFTDRSGSKTYETAEEANALSIKQDLNEIAQLKQELERVDREGFGALKPIYNFYENTVKNVLNKQYGKENVNQVTDEYGNTWNEIEIVPEREQKSILLQKEEMPASRASTETLNKVKEVAKQMGVVFQDLLDYAKGNPSVDTKGANGLADLVKGVIAIASGKENVALTEEMIHIARSIMEQTNPELVTSMISQIGKYKIYKKTFEAYKNNKNYQLSNGKPDIRKIKMEAVDKLIAEHVINRNEGSTEFPELMEKETVSLIESWWETIKSGIRSLFGKTNVDLFDQAAQQIMSGQLGGTVADIKEGGVFLQKAEPNEVVDKIVNKILDIDSKTVLAKAVYDSSGNLIKKRQYKYDGTDVDKSVTEKIKEGQKMPERTPEQKAMDEQKRDWGTEGHDYVENYIKNNLIDKDGYALDVPLDEPVASTLNADVTEKLEKFAKELIGSYPPGTRFLLEKQVVNTTVKGMLASKMDFIAVEPVINEDGTKDARVDILDWKFMNINKEKEHDVPWYKKKEWIPQMGEYSKIIYTYGVTRKQLRKARMIPFHANYSYTIPGQPDSGLQMTSVEIGKLDNAQETNMYLLPVPLPSESTGNPKVDKLIKSLMYEYEKLWKKPVSEKGKPVKEIQLNKLSDAIRMLHLQLNFDPLYAVGKTFLNNAKKTIDSFAGIDYSKLSEAEIDKKLTDLLQIEASAKKYADLDNIFLSHFPKEGLTEEGKKTLDNLKKLSSSTKNMMEPIKRLQKEFAIWKAVKEGITTQKIGLPAEIEIDVASKTFLEASTLSSRIINLATDLIMRAKSLVDIKTNKMVDAFGELLIPLEKEARAVGKTAFEMIGTINKSTLSLIKKIDSKFWEKMTEATDTKDKQFFLDNMDIEEFNKRAKDLIESSEKEFADVVFSSDPTDDASEREYKINKLKDSIDINRSTFNGYDSYQFRRLFKETMNEEKHLSKEYKDMAKSEAALKMWNFFTNLNERARDMGYLKNKAMSFFPLMEANYLQKFSNTTDLLKESKDFFADMWTVRAAEKVNFANVDEETHELIREIPKHFTITDRAVSQLSTDLNKVGVLWINALNEYENARNLENTLLTLHSVEKAKGRVVVDKDQNIIFEDGDPIIDEKNNKNADILMTIIDDEIYGIKENSGSLGNVQIGNLSDKIRRTEEGKEKTKLSIKKGFDNSNKLVQALAVGLKPLVAIPNYFGTHFQMFINSGGFYKSGTYEKNHAMLLSGVGLTTIDKGLIDITVPLNDSLTTEKRRELAMKDSFIKWLGTWTFTDIMMITNSAPDRLHQFTNAKSFNDNSMVVDGKIVNIRKYVKAQDRKAREAGLSYEERRALEKSFESRVEELKNTKSLPQIAERKDGYIVIPGVSDEELARYRTTIVEFGRQLTGQMSQTNKADYRRDAIFKSFMMFKSWIVKQVGIRTLDVKKNVQLDEWQYGRARAFAKTWFRLGMFNINGMRQVILGTDEGLAFLKEMLDEKKKAHFLKTGQELEITEEEFYDMMRTQIVNQMKELGLLIGIMALYLAAKAAEPPEDATDLEKNRYKWWMKGLHKISDELAFYYNPISTESITKGSLVPALGLLSKAQKAMWSVTTEVYGIYTDDQELIDESHPTKYFLDIIPGASQGQRELLPYFFPELAKEMGIRVSAEARRQ